MTDEEINNLVIPLFDGGSIKALSDAAWRRRRFALSDACMEIKADIVAIIQRVEAAQSDQIERLHCLINAAPDPAFYKPEELEGAWKKWHRAVGQEMSVERDTGEE